MGFESPRNRIGHNEQNTDDYSIITPLSSLELHPNSGGRPVRTAANRNHSQKTPCFGACGSARASRASPLWRNGWGGRLTLDPGRDGMISSIFGCNFQKVTD